MFLTGRVVLVALLVCAALAACDDAPQQSSAASGTPAAGAQSKLAGLPPGMVAAVASGKGVPSISVHFELGSTPAVGMTMPIKIAIVPHRNFKLVRAYFRSHDGLQVSTGGQFDMLREVNAEQVLEHQLSVQPTRDGVFLISVGLETDGDEGNITRSFSIPVIVQTTAPAANSG